MLKELIRGAALIIICWSVLVAASITLLFVMERVNLVECAWK